MMTSCCSTGIPGKKIKRIIDPTALKSIVFCMVLKIYNSFTLCAGSRANMNAAALSSSPINDHAKRRYWGKKSKNNHKIVGIFRNRFP
jgi:hypothetical protein